MKCSQRRMYDIICPTRPKNCLVAYRLKPIFHCNAKSLAYCPTRTPNARDFALQWNIGFSLYATILHWRYQHVGI